MQVICSLKAGLLVQRLTATWRGGLHSSPHALVTTVLSRVVLRRVRNCLSYYYYYYYYYAMAEQQLIIVSHNLSQVR